MFLFLQQCIYSFLSTLGFSILFNSPKDCLIKASLCGMLGWSFSTYFTGVLDTPIGGSFLGALTVGIVGELFAKRFKKPATVFIIPGIIPLVPGAGMYYTMLSFIRNQFNEAIRLGSTTIFTAFSIAIAVIVASSITKGTLRYIDLTKGKKEVIKKR